MKRLLIVLSLLTLSACVYVQGSHVHHKGSRVDKERAALVQPGKTDKEWVFKNLGTPDRIQAEQSGLEIYEYISERRERSEKKFILLFSVESERVVARTVTRVVLRDGIVESINTTDV